MYQHKDITQVYIKTYAPSLKLARALWKRVLHSNFSSRSLAFFSPIVVVGGFITSIENSESSQERHLCALNGRMDKGWLFQRC